jgi:hypothetical protein
MDSQTHTRASIVAALLTALDDYANWLSMVAGPPGFRDSDTSVGQGELWKLLEIRRTWFPHLTQETTELLVVHTDITSLLYERQLRAVRGSTSSGDFDDLAGCAGLVRRQLAAIEQLRRAVAPPEFKSSSESPLPPT